MSDDKTQQPTVESIMATLAEAGRLLKEIFAMQKESEAQIKEIFAMQKDSERRQKENEAQLKETGLYLKRLGKQLGEYKNQWGKIAQYLVGSDFDAILKESFGIDVTYWVKLYKGKYQDKEWEIDVAAANGDVAVVGEVKVTMSAKDIDTFVANNLRNFHLYVPEHRNKKIYGLIAFMKIDEGYEKEVLASAQKYGLLVVKAIGKTFTVVTPAGTKLRDYGQRG